MTDDEIAKSIQQEIDDDDKVEEEASPTHHIMKPSTALTLQ
jgi:hypothetical protein